VGIGHLHELLGSDAPGPVAGPAREIESIVTNNDWSLDRCVRAVDVLHHSMQAHRESYESLLGNRLADLELAAQALADGFAYRSGTGNEAENARDRSIYDRYLALRDTLPGPAYGKWGAEHVYQAEYRRRTRFGELLARQESPAAGGVVSILMAYNDSSRLTRDRRGELAVEPFRGPARLVRPLAAVATDGTATLFRLSGPGSPFDESLALIDRPTAGGVTSDYVQYAILMRGAVATTPLE
jgi:hypothetical protein